MEQYEYIAHHGIKGQKWGVRRFQNEDGSLTPEGRKHYGVEGKKRYFTENVKETAKRSAKASAKAGFKEQSLLSGVGVGTATALMAATGGVAAIPATLLVGGAAFVSSVGATTAVSALAGYAHGASAAHKQDEKIQKAVSSGEEFVTGEITYIVKVREW